MKDKKIDASIIASLLALGAGLFIIILFCLI